MAPKILVVDDTQAIRRSVRLRIERETDWQICGEAENGREAIERVKELRPDFVLLDLSMPVMNGLDAPGTSKRSRPTFKSSCSRCILTPNYWTRPGRQVFRRCSPNQARLTPIFCMLSVPCWLPDLASSGSHDSDQPSHQKERGRFSAPFSSHPAG